MASKNSQPDFDELSIGVVRYTDLLDLSKEQVITTKNAYRLHAQDYALKYERNKSVIKRAIPNTVIPFLSVFNQYQNKNSSIIFAGCGSCRDLQYCEQKGYNCSGIDTSKELLDIAKNLGVKSPLQVNDINYYQLEKNSLGGIFCDTALSHTPKRLLVKTLQNFREALKDNGVLFMELRQGDGKVYYTIDDFGERYYTTFSKDETVKLLQDNGFQIENIQIDKHPFSSRPMFIAIIASKV